MAHEENNREIGAYAQVYIHLTDDFPLDEVWRKMILSLGRDIRSRLNIYPSNNSLDGVLEDILTKRVAAIRGRMARTVRQKRGILDFVGQIGSALFGTATTSDVRAVAEANKKLAGKVEGVIVDQRKVIATVNVLGRQQKEVLGTVNEVIKKQRRIEAEIQAIGQIETSLQFMQLVARYMLVLDLIAENLIRYEEAVMQVEGVRTACESRIVNEKSIPLSMIREILTAGGNIARVVPYAYYAYVEVEKIMELDHKIFCVLRAPLFTGQMKSYLTWSPFL